MKLKELNDYFGHTKSNPNVKIGCSLLFLACQFFLPKKGKIIKKYNPANSFCDNGDQRRLHFNWLRAY